MASSENPTIKIRSKTVKAFSLDKNVFNDIKDIADSENRSISNTVETALKQWASERKKVLAV